MHKTFRNILAASVLGLGCAATPASATVLLSDNFDSDSAGSSLNFNGFVNWTVNDGTVDYVRQGGFGLGCVGSAGGCVDLDGSTSNVGRMVSRSTFVLDAGTTYRFSLDFSGNQRGGASDGIRWGITDGATDLATAVVGSILPAAPFLTDFMQFSGFSGPVRLFVEDTNPGGDNIGPVLDNVVFESLNRVQVPEPGALGLLGIAMLGMVASRRR